MNILACDLGGTKVLLGIYEEKDNYSAPKIITKKKYDSYKYESFYSILDHFLNEECKDLSLPNSACFGVAGPVNNGIGKITNLNWEISAFELTKNFNLKYLEVINDFAILIYGIPFILKNQFKTIQNIRNIQSNDKNLHAVVGAGTGLGISRGLISNNKIDILPSEGGHMEFSPRSDLEWEIKNWLMDFLRVKRVSNERIISGQGLTNIARWRLDKKDAKSHPLHKILKEAKISQFLHKNLPSKICEMSDNGDTLMQEIKNIWLGAYASFLGDIAIHELCYGGLWIAGGTAPKHINYFNSESFLKQFSNKGRLKDIVETIPVRVILDEDFGLHSAACRAKMLLKINKTI